MTFDFWILYATAVLVASLVPGPSMLLALSHGTKFGTKRTMATAFGNTTASFLQATVAIFGLGAILTASGVLFQLVKWLGAAYLIYTGIKMWRTPAVQLDTLEEGHNGSVPLDRMFWQAFFVAVGNPKAIVFFTALFPQFIDENAQQMGQYVILVTTLAVIAFASFMVYAIGGNQIRLLIKQPLAKKYFYRFIAGTFVGVGISLAASKR